MAVQLSSFYMRNSFQLLVKLDTQKFGVEGAFEQASQTVYSWGKNKFRNVIKNAPKFEELACFSEKRDGSEFGALMVHEDGLFAFRAAHPDASVAGRMWVTDTELKVKNNQCFFAVKLSVTSPQSCEESVPFSCPAFVKWIAHDIGIYDVISVDDRPGYIEREEQVEEFVSLLTNVDRQMPILLLTPCNNPNVAPYNGYMLNDIEMAKILYGWAHVFSITPEMTECLIAKVGRQWSAYDGAVRTYYPGLDFEKDDCYDHPLVTQRIINLKNFEAENENGCTMEIVQHIDRKAVVRKILWRKHEIEFFSTEYQKYLQRQRATGIKSNELLASYKEQVEQLESQRDEYAALAESYADDLENLKNNMENQQQTLGWQRNRIIELEDRVKKLSGEKSIETIPENGIYEGIPDWINTYYRDRIYLHKRAIKSLKSAVYENVNLVYRCLKLLATQYYGYRLGMIDREEFEYQCHLVDAGLDESGAITDVQAGTQGDTYFVVYQGKRRKLERHLRKGGGGKDPRNQLRIYFFWDDDNQLVVIGDLPEHLDTRAT